MSTYKHDGKQSILVETDQGLQKAKRSRGGGGACLFSFGWCGILSDKTKDTVA